MIISDTQLNVLWRCINTNQNIFGGAVNLSFYSSLKLCVSTDFFVLVYFLQQNLYFSCHTGVFGA